MNNTAVGHIIRFVALILVQALLISNIDFGSWGYYFKVIIYPLALLYLPLRLPIGISLAIAFIAGLSVDMFGDTAGLHAGTCVAMMFFRPLIINGIEPRGGYENNPLPDRKKLGNSWFLRYIAYCFIVFMVVLFLYETFLFEKFGLAFIKAFFSYLVSLPLVIIIIFIFGGQGSKKV